VAPKQSIIFFFLHFLYPPMRIKLIFSFFFNFKRKFPEANRNPKSSSFAIRNHLLHSFLTLSLARGASYNNNKKIVCGFRGQISFLFGEQIYFMFA
jgi:hypothetical protein